MNTLAKCHHYSVPPTFPTQFGQHMQQFAESRDIKVGTKRLLIGGMAANKMAVILPLLKRYIKMGLEVTKVYQVIEYMPIACFK